MSRNVWGKAIGTAILYAGLTAAVIVIAPLIANRITDVLLKAQEEKDVEDCFDEVPGSGEGGVR